jgi:hypothetical protein
MTGGRLLMIKKIFLFLGWMGMAAAVVAVAYSWFGVRPRLQKLTHEIQNDLSDVASVTQSVGGNDQPAIRLLHLLPDTATALHGTLLTASQSLYSSAKTTNDVKKGITGLVMPKTALGLDTRALAQTGRQLTLLAGMVEQMQKPLSDLQKEGDQLPTSLGRASSRIENLQNAVEKAALPFHASLLGFASAALYFFFGSFCFVTAYAFEAVMTGQKSQITERKTSEFQRLAS